MRKGKGFTLIELLVVIAVVALLMAILLPVLGRVRRQTRAVVCQSNLRQWGTIWVTYLNEYDGRLPAWDPRDPSEPGGFWEWGWGWRRSGQYRSAEGILCCPIATKFPSPIPTLEDWWRGGTFLAWGRVGREGTYPRDMYGSYGSNRWVYGYWYRDHDDESYQLLWRTSHVRSTSDIPVQLDSCWVSGWLGRGPWDDTMNPPECDAVPRAVMPEQVFCINRHNGGINSLFMDWSVRKVGLKELWVLKWHRQYNTANRWTKVGGALPEDWPEWMRNFKDY